MKVLVIAAYAMLALIAGIVTALLFISRQLEAELRRKMTEPARAARWKKEPEPSPDVDEDKQNSNSNG